MFDKKRVDDVFGGIMADYKEKDRFINTVEICEQPNSDEVRTILLKLLELVFPGFYKDRFYHFNTLESRLNVLLEDVLYNLSKQIECAIMQSEEYKGSPCNSLEEKAQEICLEFLASFPKIRSYIETDVIATFDGDPAAFNYMEIILAYPGILAISSYRIAHELYNLNVPMIPRIMTEFAHSKTGIDINPGAKIDKYFFIDHGTGIVIGETTVIGKNVKIYQGVTLGALSTRGGQRLAGVKRHPTIEDNVTIYSGASILGGDTVIGHDAVIGGNSFITSSVEPYSRVSVKNVEHDIKSGIEKEISSGELNG
ncbi:MAG: serine acetyltransferase [Eubacterium sp.]|nr:serine acetyltransferase [Eubacterium sp.]